MSIHEYCGIQATPWPSCACPTLTCFARTAAGSAKAEKEVKAAVLGENSTPQTHPMPNKFFSVPIATPSFLSQEELSMRAARGLVGSVACVLDV